MFGFLGLSSFPAHVSVLLSRPVHYRRTAIRRLALTLFTLTFSTARAAESDDVVAVFSSVSPDYKRVHLPNGAIKPETFAFGSGGRLSGAAHDHTIDQLSFTDIALQLAPSLAAQGYVACDQRAPDATNLLIMVYWGTTIGTDGASASPVYEIAQSIIAPPLPPPPPAPTGQPDLAMVSDPTTSGAASRVQQIEAEKAGADAAAQQIVSMTAMANRMRDRQNLENAATLGYLDELKRVQDYRMTAFNQRRQDIVDEVEESRYYVVLLAYDFQLLRKHKQRKLLWQTRFSIRERRNDFAKQLSAMTQSASRFFGQDSGGLVRKPLLNGHVDLGETKSLGAVH